METYKHLWSNAHKSVCTLEFFNDNGIKVQNLIGFKVNKFLITDIKFFEISAETTIRITFYKENGSTINKQTEIPYLAFFQKIHQGIIPNVHPIVVFKFDIEYFDDIPSLKLASDTETYPGLQVALIANNSNAQGLQLSPGMVTASSIKKYGRIYKQTNTVVNLESFGSPLINAETNEVIGIVNMDGLNKQYDIEYITDLTNQNIQTLNSMSFENPEDFIDIKETFIAMQNQVKYLAKMIMKYSDHGKVNILNASYLNDFIEEIEAKEELHFVKTSQTRYINK